jgi:hypothetical protein
MIERSRRRAGLLAVLLGACVAGAHAQPADTVDPEAAAAAIGAAAEADRRARAVSGQWLFPGGRPMQEVLEEASAAAAAGHHAAAMSLADRVRTLSELAYRQHQENLRAEVRMPPAAPARTGQAGPPTP